MIWNQFTQGLSLGFFVFIILALAIATIVRLGSLFACADDYSNGNIARTYQIDNLKSDIKKINERLDKK